MLSVIERNEEDFRKPLCHSGPQDSWANSKKGSRTPAETRWARNMAWWEYGAVLNGIPRQIRGQVPLLSAGQPNRPCHPEVGVWRLGATDLGGLKQLARVNKIDEQQGGI